MNVTPSNIRNIMKNLLLTSADGCSLGFLNVLPLGCWAEQCINLLLNPIRNALNARQMKFPLVFSSDNDRIKQLIQLFNQKNEIFHLQSDQLALSYSPDPNLLLWLADKKLKSCQLPYTIETLSIFLRKNKAGGLNGLDRLRQFSFPGVFTLTRKKEAEKTVIFFLTMASNVMNIIFENNWKTKISTTYEYYRQNKMHFDTIAKVTGKEMEFTFIEKQIRYFTYKLGLYANASYSDLMIFNLQWDNTNPLLFNITSDCSDDVVIIHSTFAGAVNRVFPALIGNGLEKGIKIFLPVVAPYQIGIIFNENDKNKSIINKLINLCKKNNFRYYLADKSSFNTQVAKIDQHWIPYLIIIPPDATSFEDIKIFDRTQNKIRISLSMLMNALCSLPTTHASLTHTNLNYEMPF